MTADRAQETASKRPRDGASVMQTLRLALRLVARDWRAGELRVLIAAIVLAVSSVGTVGFFADRVKSGLAQQANLLLGADLMVSAIVRCRRTTQTKRKRSASRHRRPSASTAWCSSRASRMRTPC